MKTFKAIRNAADRLDIRMRGYIRERYETREKTPEVHRVFLMNGDTSLADTLDTVPTNRLLHLCTAIDGAERRAKERIRKERETAAKAKAAKKEKVVIYTDGGYSNQYGIGAGAYVILGGNRVLKMGGDRIAGSTSAAAELTAILLALKAAPRNTDTEIRTDSQYAIGVLTGWKAKKNAELVARIKTLAEKKKIRLTFSWVKGHSGEKYNEMCDRMCDRIAGLDLNIEYEKYKKQKSCRKTATQTATSSASPA